ncbi:hypothetical protein O181_118657 [Austropuccinia psidii MF-1]|uniref:Uncharacterized protein n=1 Tax=Austropuccinia psidii MF-1 TaxID=1389203 RepID=A0A9Q3KFR2_9BASI|nr:hypothetical protein [Austropuccinia psidii MF-1]
MTNLQPDSSSEDSRPLASKTPPMKAPEFFDGAQPFQLKLKYEEADGTKAFPAPLQSSQGTGGSTLAQYNQPVSNQSEPS